jgi:F0F1-type ATP synthase assembly protein I
LGKKGEWVASRRDKTPDLWTQALYYASLSFIIPGSGLAGYLAGWYLDHYLGTSPVLAIVGAIAGAASGVAEVLQIIARMEKRAARKNQPDDHESG